MPARRPNPRSRRLLPRLLAAALAAMLLDALWLALIWPDWAALASGPVPKSAYVIDYEAALPDHPELPPLLWQPVAFERIAPVMGKAVVVAEDARFWQHRGVDLAALREAMAANWRERRFAYGASTLSQQTARNLFLSPARNPLRKWHELVLTLAMERHLEKRRILEIYLNSAQLGRGIFGVEAAARHYFGISAAELSRDQAVRLAATLPSPARHNPATETPEFRRRVEKISRHLGLRR